METRDKDIILPINYQYQLSCWIYQILSRGDAGIAELGQPEENRGRHYKLFTFSTLQIPQFKVEGDRLNVLCPKVYLKLSFFSPEGSEAFVKGLFWNQQFYLGDQKSGATFSVTEVESQPLTIRANQAVLRTISPVCVSKTMMNNGKPISRYLSPDDANFENYFFNNLIKRYIITHSKVYALNEQQEIYQPYEFSFQLMSEPRSKLITFRSGTAQETKIRGYIFDFVIKAPEELLKFGYEAGFGEKNSLGFGCVEIM